MPLMCDCNLISSERPVKPVKVAASVTSKLREVLKKTDAKIEIQSNACIIIAQ